MPHIYIPASSPEDWQQFLADPKTQWRTGFSAKATAYAWQEADGFPNEISVLLSTAPIVALRGTVLLLAIPEHKVYFPPSQGHPSQNDVFVLAKAMDGALLTIAVEAKVSESFDRTVNEWSKELTPGKAERLGFLTRRLEIEDKEIGHVRYQLLHRLASALLEAERFGAGYAALVVHSFSQSDEWFDDYAEFVALYDKQAAVGRLTQLFTSHGIKVLSGWARGSARYLEI